MAFETAPAEGRKQATSFCPDRFLRMMACGVVVVTVFAFAEFDLANVGVAIYVLTESNGAGASGGLPIPCLEAALTTDLAFETRVCSVLGRVDTGGGASLRGVGSGGAAHTSLQKERRLYACHSSFCYFQNAICLKASDTTENGHLSEWSGPPLYLLPGATLLQPVGVLAPKGLYNNNGHRFGAANPHWRPVTAEGKRRQQNKTAQTLLNDSPRVRVLEEGQWDGAHGMSPTYNLTVTWIEELTSLQTFSFKNHNSFHLLLDVLALFTQVPLLLQELYEQYPDYNLTLPLPHVQLLAPFSTGSTDISHFTNWHWHMLQLVFRNEQMKIVAPAAYSADPQRMFCFRQVVVGGRDRVFGHYHARMSALREEIFAKYGSPLASLTTITTKIAVPPPSIALHSLKRHHGFGVPSDRGESFPIDVLLMARKGASKRSLNNTEAVVALILSLGASVRLVDFEEKDSFGDVAEIVGAHSVLLGMHGNSLTNMIFLPSHASVIEMGNSASSYLYADLAEGCKFHYALVRCPNPNTATEKRFHGSKWFEVDIVALRMALKAAFITHLGYLGEKPGPLLLSKE